MNRPAAFIFLLLYSLLLLAGVGIKNTGRAAVQTIILDAGHGGKDPGARGWNGNWEKDIALEITLRLGKELEKEMPDVKLIYTRKDDSYPTLYERSNIANNNKADLFVSVHCNSRDAIHRREPNGTRTETYYVGKGRKKKKMTREVTVYKTVKYPNPAKGLETYVWEPGHNFQKIDALAEAENAEIYKDPNYKEKYGGGFDIKSPEFAAKAALRTKKYFQRSVKLAGYVQDEGSAIGRVNGDIRQRSKGIWVLQATAMPSILVETGYLSNPTEEAYLASDKGQDEMAKIIARAIKKYKSDLENPAPAENKENTRHPEPEQPGKATMAKAAFIGRNAALTAKSYSTPS
jgi:N-acetylmuramoyl-L-alanine amidase